MNAQAQFKHTPLTSNQESAVLQNSLQAALKAASDKQAAQIKPFTNVTIMKPNLAAANSELPMLIPRVDLLNNRILFLAHTLDRQKNTLQMWDMKHGHKPTVVSKAFYDSTLPITEKAETTKMVQEYSKEFGVKELVLRSRLIKTPQIEKSDDGSISKEAQEAWKNEMKAKFKVAFEKALDEAFAQM